jgi:hypothetical protein
MKFREHHPPEVSTIPGRLSRSEALSSIRALRSKPARPEDALTRVRDDAILTLVAHAAPSATCIGRLTWGDLGNKELLLDPRRTDEYRIVIILKILPDLRAKLTAWRTALAGEIDRDPSLDEPVFPRLPAGRGSQLSPIGGRAAALIVRRRLLESGVAPERARAGWLRGSLGLIGAGRRRQAS